LLHPSRYAEFRWRWDNFKFLLVIRSKVLQGEELQPLFQSWLDTNAEGLAYYGFKNNNMIPPFQN
jgi:hypothetical protein